MKMLLQFLLKVRPQREPSQVRGANGGFTMIELLVGAIMAFLIITPLLGFVVSILEDDRREGVKAATEDEIQTALEYIEDDVSQAIHIYDQKEINALTNTTTNPNPVIPTSDTATPILVFWARELVENGVPFDPDDNTITCPTNENKCDDTYVLKLVAYYLETDNNATWCPDLTNCPYRITRFESRDGVQSGGAYLCGDDGRDDSCDPKLQRDEGFPLAKEIDTAELTVLQRPGSEGFGNTATVLVNYIDDSSTANVPDAADCSSKVFDLDEEELEARDFDTKDEANEDMLVATDSKSFYACVDRFKTVAQIHIRGNALRRLQTDATYDPDRTAYFPSFSVLVQGQSQFGTE